MFTMTDELLKDFPEELAFPIITFYTAGKPQIQVYKPHRNFSNKYLRLIKLSEDNTETGARSSIYCGLQFQTSQQVAKFYRCLRGHDLFDVIKLIETLPMNDDHAFVLYFLRKCYDSYRKEFPELYAHIPSNGNSVKPETCIESSTNDSANKKDDSNKEQKPLKRFSLRLFSKNQKNHACEEIAQSSGKRPNSNSDLLTAASPKRRKGMK